MRPATLAPFKPTFPTPASEQPTAPGEADPTDHVYGDVKTRFLGFMRISNLITVRSDSFTLYTQVHAWQNIGTSTPTLVGTKRVATLLDRSQVKPVRNATSNTINLAPAGAINVPND